MKKAVVGLMLAMLASTVSAKDPQPLTTEQIKQELIRESIESYPGKCPCPYNTARNGSSCGHRSAYSRPGGYSPLCYPKDVSEQMVEKYQIQRK